MRGSGGMGSTRLGAAATVGFMRGIGTGMGIFFMAVAAGSGRRRHGCEMYKTTEITQRTTTMPIMIMCSCFRGIEVFYRDQ
jgi:hypothetical protein